MKLDSELVRGAGATAVLQLLSSGEKYGYELIEALAQHGDGVLALGQSTLYPMLYNLEAKKFIQSRIDESGPRARRYYRLTVSGKKRLATAAEQWQALNQVWQSLKLFGNPTAKGAV